MIGVMTSYIKENRATIVAALISYGLFFLVSYLYSLPFGAIGYAALLSLVFILLIATVKFHFFYQRHLILQKLAQNINVADSSLPIPQELIERDYQDLIRIIREDRLKILNEKNKAYSEMVDYYTIWAHQIKTPIAAMRLLLQAERTELNSELQEQLFRVEQYVEMVLQYLRLENMSSDLLFSRYSLDDIVRQAVRKYAKTFIRKKLRLHYEGLDYNVLTDEKWLIFVVEQLLSNALKYTNEGEISIYMDKYLPDTLVIEDTGLGITPEDLPRVFEKGFTGYNGRADKKSTGIGLYLCKQIINRLSHKISIESEIAQGTRVRIGLATKEIPRD